MPKNLRTLGRSGLVVSPLALGTMTFGTPRWGSPDVVSEAIFNAYVDAGGNFIDSADVYAGGRSEELLGAFVADRKLRDRLVLLATKFSFHGGEAGNPNGGGNGRKNLHRALHGSLRRLRTDCIDLYWLHVWHGVTPAEELLQSLCDLLRAGKIRYFGLSNMPAWAPTRCAGWMGAVCWRPFYPYGIFAPAVSGGLFGGAAGRRGGGAALDLGTGRLRLGPVINCRRPNIEFGLRQPMKTNVAQVGTEGRPVGTHQRPAAGTRGPGRCYGTGQPAVCRHGAVPIARRHAVVRLARAVRGLAGGAPAPFAVAQVGCLGAHLQDFVAGPEQRVPDDRFDHRSSPPAQLRGKRAAPETQAIGRSRAGLSTKIHTTVGALGNPTGFHLTPGQAHDLEGADVLLKDTAAATVLADKADDAQARVVELPLTAGKTIVMALRATRTDPRDDDRHLYQARPLIENFFARLKQYCCIATRHDKTTRIFLGAVHLASAMAWLN